MTNLKINDTQGSVNKMQDNFSDAKILVNLPKANEVTKTSSNNRGNILKRRQTASPKLDENYTSENKTADDKAIADYINQLPKEQKDEFLKNFPLLLEEMTNDENVTSDDKKAITAFCSNFKTFSDSKEVNEKHNVTGGSDRFNGIANIMMIIIKVFTENMNTESVDELSQINETNLANTFLQKAQEVLQENIKKNNDVLASADKKNKSHSWNPLKGDFWSRFKDWKFDLKVAIVVAAVASGGAALCASEGAEAELGGELLIDEAAAPGAEIEMQEMSTEFVEEGAEKNVVEKAEAKSLSKTAPTKKLNWGKAGGRLVQGAMIYFMAAMYLAKDEAQDISNKLQEFSLVSQYETGVINQNNNNQQTASKRMGDDSERISQASGYVQQAISMFGQAYQFRA